MLERVDCGKQHEEHENKNGGSANGNDTVEKKRTMHNYSFSFDKYFFRSSIFLFIAIPNLFLELTPSLIMISYS